MAPNVVQQMCDAVMTDLVENVPALGSLGTEQIHLYLPVPEEDVALGDERHLGVWLVGDTTAPLSTDAHERTQIYQVTVWENAAETTARQAQDVDADLAFLDLYDAILNRLYKVVNEQLAGMELTWPGAGQVGTNSSFIRKMAFVIQAKRYWAFT